MTLWGYSWSVNLRGGVKDLYGAEDLYGSGSKTAGTERRCAMPLADCGVPTL